MKKLIALWLVLACASVNATNLPADQANNVLNEIDNICGDTWCEGDFDYSFDDFKCDLEKGTCELDFQYIWYEFDENYDEPTETIYVEHSCTIEGVFGYDEMIETSRNGWDSLVWEFYEKVSDCISDGESVAYDEVDTILNE